MRYNARMELKTFLQLSCQLADSSVARVVVGERTLYFHTSDAVWQVSCEIPAKEIPSAMLIGLLSQSSEAQMGIKGLQFRCNSEKQTIILSQKVAPLDTLHKFKEGIEVFLNLVSEWEPVAK